MAIEHVPKRFLTDNLYPRLCEKPFASNGAEVAEMYAEADKQGVLLQEGMWTRFFPATEVSFPHPWCRTVGRLC